MNSILDTSKKDQSTFSMIKYNKEVDNIWEDLVEQKNVMRTPEEKEKLVLEYLNSKEGYRKIADISKYIFKMDKIIS